jgi:hypothetical protein
MWHLGAERRRVRHVCVCQHSHTRNTKCFVLYFFYCMPTSLRLSFHFYHTKTRTKKDDRKKKSNPVLHVSWAVIVCLCGRISPLFHIAKYSSPFPQNSGTELYFEPVQSSAHPHPSTHISDINFQSRITVWNYRHPGYFFWIIIILKTNNWSQLVTRF